MAMLNLAGLFTVRDLWIQWMILHVLCKIRSKSAEDQSVGLSINTNMQIKEYRY